LEKTEAAYERSTQSRIQSKTGDFKNYQKASTAEEEEALTYIVNELNKINH